jgi:hypothetical protein
MLWPEAMQGEKWDPHSRQLVSNSEIWPLHELLGHLKDAVRRSIGGFLENS